MDYAYFTANCMFTRVPIDSNGHWDDWDDAEVGTGDAYWQAPNEDYDVEGEAGARIEYEDLPQNLQE